MAAWLNPSAPGRVVAADPLGGCGTVPVRALRNRKDIDAERVGLVGASQGGWIAPLAAVSSPDVAFMILIAAPAVSVYQQELDRVEYSLRANEFSESEIAEALSYARAMFAAVERPDRWPEFQRVVAASREKPWFEHVSQIESRDDLARWRLLSYDPTEVLAKVRVPTLALYGESDTLVPPDRNAEKLAELIRRGGGEVTVRVLPNAAHNLETFGTLEGGEWSWPESHWIWPRKSPALVPIVREWLGRVVFMAAPPIR